MLTSQTLGPIYEYWLDACQRTILTLDVMRQRGEAVAAHEAEAVPNVLTFQAEGLMTPASQYAYRQAETLSPDGAGPAFFIGWAAIRQGRLLEGRELWAQKLKAMPEGTPGREELAKRLANFDQLLRKLVEQADAKQH